MDHAERDRLAVEAEALDADEEDRAEVLEVARLMASLQPRGERLAASDQPR